MKRVISIENVAQDCQADQPLAFFSLRVWRTSAVAVLVIPALFWSGCAGPEEEEAEVVVEVRTAAVETQDIQATASAPATLYARNQAQLASRLTAPVQTLDAHMGDSVRQDQVLARLVNGDLESQRAEAAAQVADAEANLEKVSAGTLPVDVERARGQVETTSAALAEAEQVYKRRQALFDEGAIPERELLTSQTQFEQAQTANRVAQTELDLLENRSREQDLRIAQSGLDQARARLAYVETQLGYSEIHSPFDGTITEQFLYPGDMAKPDSPIFAVMDLSAVVARGQFPAGQAADVRTGQSCRFGAIDSSETQSEGRVTAVNQAVDMARRTVEVWCEIPNTASRLKAGAFGQLEVTTATHPGATTVPLSAVQFEEGTSAGVVWTVGADGAAHANNVRTGAVSGERVEILEGLNPGETAITEGGYGLTDGIHVIERADAGQESAQ